MRTRYATLVLLALAAGCAAKTARPAAPSIADADRLASAITPTTDV